MDVVKFPTQKNRELFQWNREFWRKNREFKSPKLKLSPNEVSGTHRRLPQCDIQLMAEK